MHKISSLYLKPNPFQIFYIIFSKGTFRPHLQIGILAESNYSVTNSRAKPQENPSVEKHAHPPRVVYCAIYATLDTELEICILFIAHKKTRRWKSMLIHQGWCIVLYMRHLIPSWKFAYYL